MADLGSSSVSRKTIVGRFGVLETLIYILISTVASSCSWIDDINTVDKQGSYEFTSSAVEIEDAAGSDLTKNKAIACANEHSSGSFEVFDVQTSNGICSSINMYDQVSNLMNARSLTIYFEPSSAVDGTACIGAEEVVGSTVELSLDGCYRAMLALGDCSPREVYQIIGSLTLDNFSTERRETVSGSIEGKMLYIQYVSKTEKTIMNKTELGDFSISFQFPVHVGTVWMR